MSGPYTLVGARLVERNYAAIPIMPGSKRPGELKRGEWVGMDEWRERYSGRLPSRFETQVWANSNAGVCVVTGPASRHTVAIDIDTDDPVIKGAIEGAIPPTTVRKRGAKGETLFYRGPDISESKSWNIGKTRVVDLIGPGRQTVLPPTIHPDTGAPYVWTGPDALEDTDPSELPLIEPAHIEAISEALRPHGLAEKPTHPERSAATGGATSSANDPWKRLNDKAIGNLDAWVPYLNLYRCQRTHVGYEAVAVWRPSNTGQHNDRRKLNLKIHPEGITDFGDGPKGYSAIDLVMHAQSCDFDSAYDWLEKLVDPPTVIIALESRMKRKPAPQPAEKPAEAPAEPASAPDHDPVTGEVNEPETHHEAPHAPKMSLSQLARTCPGLVGEIVNWICDTARRPDPVLALGAAVSVIGTLVGRRLCGPTESGTHLYVIGLAGTGAGKQHPLACIESLMMAAKAEDHVGPSEFMSMPAVINFLLRKPLSVCAQDEFGALLKRINGKKASGFEQGISKIFRSAWGSSFQPMKTPEWAGRELQTINAPALTVLGMSTPEEFYSALQGEDISNGFLNRFLILESAAREREITPKLEKHVPEYIRKSLQELFPANDGVLRSRLNDSNCLPEPRKIAWEGETAQRVYYAFSERIDDDAEANPKHAPFMSRAAEIAVRLATIRALGRWRSDDCVVGVSDMEWGRDISHMCASKVARQASELMITEMNHGQVVNKIFDVIRKRGGKTTHAVIVNELQKNAKEKEIKATLETLMAGGDIIKSSVPPPTGGVPVIWYAVAA